MQRTADLQVTAAIIIGDGNRFLIARKKNGKPLAGFWEFPGGKLESGELPATGIIREISEELNIRLEAPEEYCRYYYSNTEKTIEFIFFTAQKGYGEIVLTDHDAIAWVTIEEISSFPLAPADEIAVDIIRKKGLPV